MPNQLIDPRDIQHAFDLPAHEAIAYLSGKGYKITFDWQELSAAAHQQAFTVAKVMQMDVLKDVRESLVEAQQAGHTYEQFREGLRPKLQQKGWWGPHIATEPTTAKTAIADISEPWRLRTVYRTNMQSSYMAGRYKQQVAMANRRPYWQYVAVGDIRTRLSHLRLNGIVLPADDPIWRRSYPPNGYNCRCRVRTLSEAQVQRDNMPVLTSADPAVQQWQPEKGFDSSPADGWQPDLTRYPDDLVAAYKQTVEARLNAPSDPLKFGPPEARDPIQKQWYNGNVTLSRNQNDEQDILDLEDDLFGRELDEKDYAGITGAPDGAKIFVQHSQNYFGTSMLRIGIKHPFYDDESIRLIYRNDDGLVEMHNDFLALDKRNNPPSRLGTRVFATQVATARQIGIDLISVYAAGDINNSYFNGYYTWPRLGYDGPIDPYLRRQLPPSLAGAMRISDLMATEEGRDWWRDNGESINLEFDLTDGSYSLTFLASILNSTGIRL
jgi:SPP1 gp7 family putative phage head morphogenesis protein